jgi:hypothetical protein
MEVFSVEGAAIVTLLMAARLEKEALAAAAAAPDMVVEQVLIEAKVAQVSSS